MENSRKNLEVDLCKAYSALPQSLTQERSDMDSAASPLALLSRDFSEMERFRKNISNKHYRNSSWAYNSTKSYFQVL